jgi:hypothetical protein
MERFFASEPWTVVSGALSDALAYTLGFDAEAARVRPRETRARKIWSPTRTLLSVCRQPRNKRPGLRSSRVRKMTTRLR